MATRAFPDMKLLDILIFIEMTFPGKRKLKNEKLNLLETHF